MNLFIPNPIKSLRPNFEFATYEYSGVQRTGKSTLMNNDILLHLSGLLNYKVRPERVFVNWSFFVPGVNCINNTLMLETLLRAKREGWTECLFGVDEGSQVLKARGYQDKTQTEIVTTIWQMPKRRNVFMYSSNIGNSVDVQLRDGTWYIVVPQFYFEGWSASGVRERHRDYIEFAVCHSYELWEGLFTFDRPSFVQDYFNTEEYIA